MEMSEKFWDNSYSDKAFVYGKQANRFVQVMSHRLNPRSAVACFAEGEGRNAVYLAELGHDVIAYDQSSVGLKKAQQLAKEKGVSIQVEQKDLTKEMVPANKYDAAVMVFGHVPREKQRFLIHTMLASVKTGGYLILEVYSEDQLAYRTGGPKETAMLYNPIDLLTWFREQKWIHFYYGEAERHEGIRHSGLCHVIQVVVQKQ